MNKKILLAGLALGMLAGSSAYAGGLDVELNLGEPAPVYVAPAPVYVSPYPAYYDPHHRRHDWQYWRDRRAHEDHHDHWDHR